jgi:hypothetical protein
MKARETIDSEKAEEEPFLSRWSRRKQASEQDLAAVEEAGPATPEEAPPPLTDADMPPLESLHENSDYSGFLSPEVTDELRQLALQKLFRSASFNVCDGLDDYAEDYTSFEKLGDLMTADLRFRLRQEAERAAERANAEATVPEQVEEIADSEAQLATAQQSAQSVARTTEADIEAVEKPPGKPLSGEERDT